MTCVLETHCITYIYIILIYINTFKFMCWSFLFLVLSTVFLDSFLKYLGMVRHTESSVTDYVHFVGKSKMLCDARKRVMLDCYGKICRILILVVLYLHYNILSIFGLYAHGFWDFWCTWRCHWQTVYCGGSQT